MHPGKIKFLYLFFLLIIYSCQNQKNPNSSSINQSYFPLQVGNEWSYEYFFRTPAGNDTSILDFEITEKKEMNGNEYYAFNYRMPFFPNKLIIPSIGEPLFRQDINGNILTVIDNSEWLFMIFDEALVDSMIKLKLGDLDYWLYIESTNDTVQTDVGLFQKCYKILNYFPQIKGTLYYTWFAQGYGPVKIHYPEFNITYELIKVNINSKH